MTCRPITIALSLAVITSLGIAHSTSAASSARLTTSAATVDPVTEDELARIAASVRPVVETTVGLRFVDPPELTLAEKNDFALAIEQRLKSLIAPDVRDATLRAAISIVALQRSTTARGVITNDNATILFNAPTLEAAIEALATDDATREQLLGLIIANAYARAADAIPASVVPKLHDLSGFNALESLSEGWAQLVTEEYAAAQNITPLCDALTEHLSGATRRDPGGAAILRQFKLFNDTGEAFLRHHLENRGWPGLLQVLADPPLYYDAIQNPGDAVAPPLSPDILFAGFERTFPDDDQFESRRLSRELNAADIRRTYDALGAQAVTDIRSMVVHAYMHLLMTQKGNMSVTQAVTAFQLRDTDAATRLKAHLDELFTLQSRPFDRINDQPNMSVRRATEHGREQGAAWSAATVLVDSERNGETATQTLMRQVVITHGNFMVQYLGIAEPRTEDEAVAIVAQVLARMRSTGVSGATPPQEESRAEAASISRALAAASDIFERDTWAVGDGDVAQSHVESLIGTDVRANAILNMQFVTARRMTCESNQAGLLGRRQVETIVVQLNDTDDSAYVARAMMLTFGSRCEQLAAQRGSGITVGNIRTRQFPNGGRLQRMNVDIDGVGSSTMICAAVGEYIITVLTADGDPYADGARLLHDDSMEAFTERIMRELGGR